MWQNTDVSEMNEKQEVKKLCFFEEYDFIDDLLYDCVLLRTIKISVQSFSSGFSQLNANRRAG